MPDGSLLANHIAPAVGSVIAQLLFLSPMPELLAAKRRGSLGSLNPWPFSFIILNGTGWLCCTRAAARAAAAAASCAQP